MKQPFKFLSLITILGIMAIPLCLAIAFLLKQQIVAHQAFEKLENSASKTYQFSLAYIHWVKEGKELLVNGKMFDVKHSKITGNNIEITGIFDEEEDALQQQFYLLFNPVQRIPTPLQNFLIKSIFTPIFIEQNYFYSSCFSSFVIESIVFNYKENSIYKSYPINIPPPKTFC